MLISLLAMSIALALETASEDALTFDEWRASGARPVVVAVLEDGRIDEAERAVLTALSTQNDGVFDAVLPDQRSMSVTPTSSDRDCINAILTRVNLNEWSTSNEWCYAYLALSSDHFWERIRRHRASQLFDHRASFARYPSTFELNTNGQASRQLLPTTLRNAIELLDYQAWGMISEHTEGEPPRSAIEVVRPECLDAPRGC